MNDLTRPRPSGALAAALVLLFAVTLMAGCAGSTTTRKAVKTADASAATFPVTVTDDASRTVTIPAKPARIVSLAPANTEILFASGVPTAAIVGVTTFDDYPAEVKSLPKVGDFMNPNIEAITAARPDVILATGGVQGDVIAKLEATGAKVVVVDPKTLPGLYSSIGLIGRVTGETGGSGRLIAEMKSEIAAVGAKIAFEEPTSAFMEVGWDPLYTAGRVTLIDDLLTAAGGANTVKQTGYVPYSVEQLLKDDPAVYLAVKGTQSTPGRVAERAGYDRLRAVRGGHVVVLDDNLITRPGPRVVLGIREMAEALHPDAFK